MLHLQRQRIEEHAQRVFNTIQRQHPSRHHGAHYGHGSTGVECEHLVPGVLQQGVQGHALALGSVERTPALFGAQFTAANPRSGDALNGC